MKNIKDYVASSFSIIEIFKEIRCSVEHISIPTSQTGFTSSKLLPVLFKDSKQTTASQVRHLEVAVLCVSFVKTFQMHSVGIKGWSSW